MIAWVDAFLGDLQSNTQDIEKTFDDIVGCYFTFIEENQKCATDRFWKFLDKNDLLPSNSDGRSVLDLIYNPRLWFRGRKKDKNKPFDEQNIESFFHVPFDKRERIGNQRFSINGQPMLYLGFSLLTVAKELECDINKLTISKSLPKTQCWDLDCIKDELAIAAFWPKLQESLDWKIFDLTNYYSDAMEIRKELVKKAPASFPPDLSNLLRSPLKIDSSTLFEKHRKKAILMQLCTFPTETKGSFIPEYVLPQILTTALMDHDYKGVIYPSTKDFSDLTYNGVPVHELNLGLFTSYSEDSNIDEKLLESFSHYLLNGSESFDFTVEQFKQEHETISELQNQLSELQNQLKDKFKSSSSSPETEPLLMLKKLSDELKKLSDEFQNPSKSSSALLETELLMFKKMLPFSLPTNQHIPCLKDSQLNGTSYFNTQIGKTELELYMKVLYETKKRILGELEK